VNISFFTEFSFIDFIKKNAPTLEGTEIVGIGDDCAVLPYNNTHQLIVTTDSLVENVHFLKNKVSAFDIGYKSIAVNLSDIAAMGGNPLAIFLSLSYPANLKKQWLEEFMQGVFSLNIPLMGGDTTSSESDIFISVTALGTIKKGKAKLRSMGKNGDILCTTGYLGASGLGLEKLLENKKSIFINDHLRPRAHLEEGHFLARFKDVHAMMDISDGLASDLKHICRQSNLSASIDIDKLPIPKGMRGKKSPISYALESGEDYCLLLSMSSHSFKKISSSFEKKFGRPLYPIGTLLEGKGEIEYFKDNNKQDIQFYGYEHFKK
jgi:thiamine-monophosphate kinase